MSPEVTAQVAALTRARGRLLAPALLGTFLFYLLADDQLGYATPGFPYVYASCAAVVLGGLTLGFMQGRIPDRWCHIASAALIWCTTSSTLATLGSNPTVGPLMLVVIQLASAGIMLHSRLLIATLVVLTGIAIPLSVAVPHVPPMMAVGALVTSAAFALFIHVLLRGATVRAFTLQVSQAQTANRLAAKLTETERLQAQLTQAQRMEAVGTLAAGLAHDMNNVLGAISNTAELLAGSARTDQGPDLRQIVAHAARGAELTRGLLAFSRRGQYRKQTVALDRVFSEALPLLRRLLPRSIEIRESLALTDVCVEGDPVHLAQIVMNLAVNAADAMKGAGVIEMRGACVPGTTRVRIEICDHARGTAAPLRAFEPFSTAEACDGLGLSVVWGLVQAHDGTIEVASDGSGTFVLELPTTTAPLAAEPLPQPPITDRLNRNTVLVVDDERAVRETTRRLLTRMGHDVLIAENGEEAVRVFKAHPEQIRFVVLDMGMPVMGGAECFARLRAHASDVPVLIATGYAEDEQVHELVAAGAWILEKPFTAAQLREQLARVVDTAAA